MSEVRREEGTPDPRWFQVMTNLLYPAVLGTLIYTYFDDLASGSQKDASTWQPLVALSLFALFVLDYAHSLREENRTGYDGWKFLADLFIVSSLFLAGKALLNKPVVRVDMVWWLFAGKLAAVVWEKIDAKRGHALPGRAVFGVETDTALCIAYAGLCVVSLMIESPIPKLVVAFAMALDAYQYYRYANLRPGRV